ncbi:CHASE2 domain-containing protein [Thalassotalea sp. PS06]|uniref:CHASE2 domain-containing protein n=1 Tax=Thalassotalea sp. PS06 TaxID=2594005 RepID=UPI00116550EB|nr:CHASE2 domain-containing protein [Thalassotalea sp. PS06]QDP01969.1 CHASE2 domain-containing protein [Thalassotalea sp. PS06]
MLIEDTKIKFSALNYSKIMSPLKTLCLVAIILLDPLGLVTATNQASSNFIDRIKSVYYSNYGQHNVVVIFIDDEFLRNTNETWPLSYQQQAVLYRRALSLKPQALFIDLIFAQDRSEEGDELYKLNALFRDYHSKFNIKTFLADLDSANSTSQFLNNYPYKGLVAWSGYKNQYPLLKGNQKTAAFILYQEYCKNFGCNFDPFYFQQPLHVQWGFNFSDKQQYFTKTSNCKPKESITNSLTNLFISDMFWRFQEDKFIQNCPYTLTIPASLLLSRDEQVKKSLKKALTNKIVLIGASIDGAKDLVHSPVHGKIAGVFYHAMALDNLISYRENYTRMAPEVFYQYNVLEIFEILLVLYIWYFKKRILHQRNSDENYEGNSKMNSVVPSNESSQGSRKGSPEEKSPNNSVNIGHAISDPQEEAVHWIIFNDLRWKTLKKHRAYPMILTILLILFITVCFMIFTNYGTINFIGLLLLSISLTIEFLFKPMVFSNPEQG